MARKIKWASWRSRQGQVPFPGGGQGQQAHAQWLHRWQGMGGHLRSVSQRGPQRVPLTPNAECDPGWSPREEADVTTQDSLG